MWEMWPVLVTGGDGRLDRDGLWESTWGSGAEYGGGLGREPGAATASPE